MYIFKDIDFKSLSFAVLIMFAYLIKIKAYFVNLVKVNNAPLYKNCCNHIICLYNPDNRIRF